jgi:hypothetical protein
MNVMREDRYAVRKWGAFLGIDLEDAVVAPGRSRAVGASSFTRERRD